MKIRDAGPDDARVIAEIRVASWRVAYAGKMPRELLDRLSVEDGAVNWARALAERRHDAAVLMVEADGSPCGFVAIGPSREGVVGEGEIYAIYLSPEVWRRGLGSGLLTAAMDRLVQLGYRSAILWVLDTNDRARRFYEAMGWEYVSRLKIDDSFGSPLREVAYRARW
jgi:ribosomal protein S18 acetylase RimI-like enzyme